MRDLRESKGLFLLGGIVAFLVVLGSAVGITAAVNDSTAWSALPVGWIAVWVAALVGHHRVPGLVGVGGARVGVLNDS
jgi:hypothetical protein